MLPPRAYTFMGLNIVRILSIIALLLVFSSNIVTLVNDIKAVNQFVAEGKGATTSHEGAKNGTATIVSVEDMDYILGSTVPNQPAGAFWAVLNRLFIVFQAAILILSELGFPSKFFDKFFPVLGRQFGLGPLGLFQMLVGAAILSHHVDMFTLVSAFFLFSIGCLNVFLGLIFRESAKSKRSITSWKDHAKSALPTHVGPVDVSSVLKSPPPFVSQLTGNSFGSKASFGSDEKSSFASKGFGRQAEKFAEAQGYLLQKPLETLPKYAAK
ncbi:hypothetical protein CPB83DRAFT_893986 [Crepidotus variabilis]|uniref:DUF7598 domain-containing protein n=1 Tax=Crepidotus variabilis TaxID=179855 RepID=A0A9P6JQD2_9AGAR|nr:hypothetical protein CPB83DRAFT_893986 [Crepidotus variabilis]